MTPISEKNTIEEASMTHKSHSQQFEESKKGYTMPSAMGTIKSTSPDDRIIKASGKYNLEQFEEDYENYSDDFEEVNIFILSILV